MSNFKNIFSIPVSKKRQTSMSHRFIAFSLILYLLILLLGVMAFLFFMDQILHRNSSRELMKSVELERLKLEVSIKSEIAIALKMANSPLIKRHFSNPGDSYLESLALEEIESYRGALEKNLIFWVKDNDKIFYTIDHEPYTVDPYNPVNYWYFMTLNNTKVYNFNVNYNPDLNITRLWINVPVLDSSGKPVGITGAGINLSNFISEIYASYSGLADLYFFNSTGEITGARNIDLAEKKISIERGLGHTGKEIFSAAKELKNNEIKTINIMNKDGIAVIGAIPGLNWYVTALYYFSITESLKTGLTALFALMMAVIFTTFAIFNIFVVKMLEPIHNIVKQISQISYDWDLKLENEIDNNDEVRTLGEFLSMTIVDQLTGIYNRRFFDGNLKKIIKLLSRTGAKLSLLMIDIDFFKKYNDTYGHDMGDRCLKDVANALSQCVIREEDFIARYGGEEFVVVLPNTDENGAKLIADKLLHKVRQCGIPHENSDAASFVTVSIGGTTGVVKHIHKGSDYIKCADCALYKSKNSGRNCYSFEGFNQL